MLFNDKQSERRKTVRALQGNKLSKRCSYYFISQDVDLKKEYFYFHKETNVSRQHRWKLTKGKMLRSRIRGTAVRVTL